MDIETILKGTKEDFIKELINDAKKCETKDELIEKLENIVKELKKG